jgi:hypothetical protein
MPHRAPSERLVAVSFMLLWMVIICRDILYARPCAFSPTAKSEASNR